MLMIRWSVEAVAGELLNIGVCIRLVTGCGGDGWLLHWRKILMRKRFKRDFVTLRRPELSVGTPRVRGGLRSPRDQPVPV